MRFRGFKTAVTCMILAIGPVVLQAGAQIQLTQTINTLAGNGTSGTTGDGTSAATAEISTGIRLLGSDRQGNTYIADLTENVVRRVDARTGVITTIAGTPSATPVTCASATSACGDGGLATAASFNTPSAVAVDAAGNVYIADTKDNRIRVINNLTGIVTSLVGTGATTSTCTGATDNLGDGCQANLAALNAPATLAFDPSGNLYIADNSKRIRQVNMSTGVITTYAGGVSTNCGSSTATCGDGGAATSAGFIAMEGIAFDPSGNLYVADIGTLRVRMILAATVGGVVHPISTIAGTGTKWVTPASLGDGGPGTSANLGEPYDVATDSFGNLYFADAGTESVQKLPNLTPGASPTFGNMVDYAGAGTVAALNDGGLPATVIFHALYGISIDPFNIMTLTNGNSERVRVIAPATPFQQTNVASTTGTKLTLNAVVVPAAGDKLTSVSIPTQAGDFKVAASSCATGTTLAVGTACTAPVTFVPLYPGQRTAPLTFTDGSGNKSIAGLQGLGVSPYLNFNAGTVSTVAGTGTSGDTGDTGSPTAARLDGATNSAIDSSGNIYIADTGNNAIRLISVSSGDISTFYSTGLSGPKGVAVDAIGNVYIADTGNHVIRVISATTGAESILAGTSGTSGYSGDGGAASSATLKGPTGLSIDNYGVLYIADTDNNAVRAVNLVTGVISTVAGNGTAGTSGDGGVAVSAELTGPEGISFLLPPAIQSDTQTQAQMAAQLIIADTGSNKIRTVNLTTGIITTLAGNGTGGYTGDGAAAASSELSSPASVASDAAGNVYIADAGNHVIREVSAATGFISTVAGTGTSGYTGDNDSASLATFTTPSGIALDAAGSLYITDSGANVLRKDIVSSGALSFGQVYINNTETLAVTALNAGNSATPLIFTAITPPAGFTYLSPTGNDCKATSTLAPGASCTMRFSFSPTAAGAVSSTLTIKTNSLLATTSSTVLLTGTGVQAASTVNVSFSPTAPVYQQATSAIISVTGNGTATPSGTVTVSIDNGPASAPISLSSGSASYSLPVLSAASHSISVSYSGDIGFTSSTGSTTLVVGQAIPIITWMPSSTSQVYGTAIGSSVLDASSPVNGTVTYTATVTGDTPVAITSSSVLLVGTYTITATLAPSDPVDYTPATSQITYTVTNIPSTILLTGPASPVTMGTSIALTAIVQVNAAPATKGQVRFFDGTHFLGRVQVIEATNSSTGVVVGTAMLHVSLSSGSHSLTAQYVGAYGVNNPVSTVLSISTTGKSPTFATLAEVADPTNPLNYDFTVTVAGNSYAGPSGTASLVDTTASNLTISSFPLSGSTLTPGATQATAVALPIAPTFGVRADLNNDGLADLVAINAATNKVAVLLGGSTTATSFNLVTGHLPATLVSADFNGDGNPDIVFVGAGWLDVYLGKGDGTFTAGQSYTFTGTAVATASDDFNQDGYNDVAVALSNGSVAIFDGAADGTFGTPTFYTTGQSTAAAISAASLAATPAGPASLIVGGSALSVLLNPADGSGSLTLSQTLPLTTAATGLAIADFNGDVSNDVIVTNGTTTAQLLLNNGSGTLGTSASLVLPNPFTQLKALDLDGDGKTDLAGVNQSSSGDDSLVVLLGNGNGTFSNTLPAANLGTNALPAMVFPADLNNDGISDFAVLFTGNSTQQVFYTEAVATGSIINLAVNGSGTHVVDAQFPGDTNYLPSTSNGVNVTTRSVTTPTLTWTPSATSIVYGTALSAGILDAAATSSGSSVPGTYVYTATPAGGAGQTVTTGTILSAGTYNLSVAFSPTNNVNYNPVNSTITFTVTAAPATITVANATKVYGAALPTFTAAASGLVNGDTLGTTVLATFSTMATQTSSVGTASITAAISGTSAGNYSFTVVPGTLTITAAAAIITVANATKIYGAALPTFSASATGLVNGDTLGTTINAALSTTATASSNAATYPITAVISGTSYSNYTFTVTPGTLTVVPAAATVTVASASKAYAAALPTFSATVSGLVNGDTYGTTVLSTLSTAATASSNAGTYTITAAMGGTSAANYTFTIVPGTLTITPVPLTVNIANLTSSYGAVPIFSASAVGLVNGDTLGTTVIIVYSSAGASPTAGLGTYPITGTISGSSAGNYAAIVNPGTLTITASNALISFTASPTVSPVGNAVVLTAAVTSATSGAPAGSVTFYNGTTSLGSAAITNGAATLSVTTLPLGTDNITAVYGGNADFYSATSAVIVVTVVTPEFTLAPAAGSASLSVLPGGTATYTFAATPQSPETVFGAVVTMSVTGLPANATYTFTPATITAGSPQTNVALVVAIPNALLQGQVRTPHGTGPTRQIVSYLAAFLLLPLAVRRKKACKQIRKTMQLCLLLLLGVAAVGGMTGCGSSASGLFTQSPQTYTLTITGTSSTSTQSTNVTLTIQ